MSWNYCFLGTKNRASEAEVEQRGDSPVLVMHDSVSKSIFAHLIPAKGVDFPSCEKVVKMIVKDLDTLGCRKVVFRRVGSSSIRSTWRNCSCSSAHVGKLPSFPPRTVEVQFLDRPPPSDDGQ